LKEVYTAAQHGILVQIELVTIISMTMRLTRCVSD